MATSLARPGVTIEQSVRNDTPTILTPSLMACIVGPCYQIVKPLSDLGSLNASALIRTAAQVWSSTLADPVASISGKYLKIAVDNGDAQVISLPVTIGAGSLSFAILKKSINSQLIGAAVDFIDSKLVITSATRGKGSAVNILVPASDSGNSALGLTAGITVGKSGYDNAAMAIPYASLPSTKAPVTALVFDETKMDLYRTVNGSLKKLSETSTVLGNSWTLQSTKVGNSASLYGNAIQPILTSRHQLVGRKVPSAKSNKLFDVGVHASISIPLGFASVGAGAVFYPDPMGTNYLSVEAVGLQNYAVDDSLPIGNYVGSAGNAVSVVFGVNIGGTQPGAACGIEVSFANDCLSINCLSSDVTLANLNTALTSSPSGVDSTRNVSIRLSYSDADSAVKLFGGATVDKTVYLAGGENPINFTVDGSASANTKAACVVGSVAVKMGGTEQTAAMLGVAGKTLQVSVNGAEYLDVVLEADTSVVSSIGTALSGIATVSAADIVNCFGEMIKVLKIAATATGVHVGHDCTVQVKSDDPAVIPALFGGGATRTETMSAATLNVLYDSRAIKLAGLAPAADYNKQASALLEKALVPGNLTATMNNMILLGSIVIEVSDATVVAATSLENKAGETITIKHTDLDAVALSLDLTGVTTVEGLVLAIRTAVNAQNSILETLVNVSYVVANSKKYIVISDNVGTAGKQVWVAAATDTLKGKIGGTAIVGTGSSLKGTTAVGGYVTVKDNGAAYALQVTSVSNGLASMVFYSGTGVSKLTPAVMSGLLLDTSLSGITYSTATGGTFNLAFRGYTLAGTGAADNAADADKEAAAVKFSGTSTMVLSYTRAWANGFGKAIQDYTRMFHGGAAATCVGDSLYNSGKFFGRVVAIEAGPGGTGSQLKLSESIATIYLKYSDWYIVAESLDATRPAPDLSFNTTTKVISVKAGVNRNAAGVVFQSNSDLYVGYTALRTDVTALAADPDYMVFSTEAEVESILGPIVPENPLAFGLSKAFANVVDTAISAIGVDEVTADAPLGTVDAYARAAELLERKAVYVIALMTHDQEVFKSFHLHVNAMSDGKDGRRERIVLTCPSQPTEKMPTLVASGNALLNDSQDTLTFDEAVDISESLNGLLDANGTEIPSAIGAELTAENGVFVDRSGDPYRYLVTKILSRNSVQITTGASYAAGSGPGTGGNDDGYYKEGAGALATFQADGETCSVFVRRSAIDATTTTGKLEVVQALQDYAAQIANRRVTVMQPDWASCEINGQEVKVPGYYLCAAWAGMTSYQKPAQPFTNLPINGFKRVIGSHDKFSEKQMAIAAAGGVNWIIQDKPTDSPFSRHQLTTDVSSIKTREYSVGKAVDMVAFMIRAVIRARIGRFNIDKRWLEETGMLVSATCREASGNHVAQVNAGNLSIDPVAPDSAEQDITMVPFFPANRINVKIYV